MRICRFTAVMLSTVLLVACWSPAAPTTKPAADAPLLTPAETKDVQAVFTAMADAGFPDTRNATVYSGVISVSATFDPTKEPAQLPSSASNTQMTNQDGRVTYGYQFNGLHFKLADGSWIIAVRHHFKPKAGDKVELAEARPVKIDTIFADAAAAHPFDAATAAAGWLAKSEPAQRERSTATMNRLVPVTMYLRTGPDSVAPAAVLLHRAGWAGAAELSLLAAEQRSRQYWQLVPWTKPEIAFDPTGQYVDVQKDEVAWHETQKTFRVEEPATALRRAMFRWCRAQLMTPDPEDAMLWPEVAAAAAKAAVDPKDPQGFAARIDALAAGMKLPVNPKEGASLPDRLASWEAGRRVPKMVVTGGNEGGAVGISTAFVMPEPAYVPQKQDLDALMALLADERPSRFADFSGPRTIGDNAWRAVASLLEADPRKLAGHPTDRPWTADERKAAAAAVQTWWKSQKR